MFPFKNGAHHTHARRVLQMTAIKRAGFFKSSRFRSAGQKYAARPAFRILSFRAGWPRSGRAALHAPSLVFVSSLARPLSPGTRRCGMAIRSMLAGMRRCLYTESKVLVSTAHMTKSSAASCRSSIPCGFTACRPAISVTLSKVRHRPVRICRSALRVGRRSLPPDAVNDATKRANGVINRG